MGKDTSQDLVGQGTQIKMTSIGCNDGGLELLH